MVLSTVLRSIQDQSLASWLGIAICVLPCRSEHNPDSHHPFLGRLRFVPRGTAAFAALAASTFVIQAAAADASVPSSFKSSSSSCASASRRLSAEWAWRSRAHGSGSKGLDGLSSRRCSVSQWIALQLWEQSAHFAVDDALHSINELAGGNGARRMEAARAVFIRALCAHAWGPMGI